MSLWNEIQEMADNAPEAGFRSLQYGKLSMTPMVMTWKTEEDGSRKPYRTPMKEGHKLAQGESLELQFIVEISELNPNLEFEYERNVNVQSTRKGVTRTDFSEIVEPSLKEVFGDKWALSADGVYVEVEDVPQVNPSKYKNDDGSPKYYRTIKFIRKFENKEECMAARNQTYKSEKVDVASGDIPEAIVAQAKALVDSIGKDDAYKAFEKMALGDYDPDALMAAVNPL